MSAFSRTLTLLTALTAPPLVHAAPPPGWQTDFKLRLGGLFEGERDLGLGLADDTGEAFADAQGSFYFRSTDEFAALMRVQGFAPSGELVVNDEDRARRSESYVALRELWIENSGFTSYPGEVLRLGRQRLRDADGLWLDRDIESLRWIFDTTLVQGQIGVAESFLTFRSDDSDPSASLRDRTYAFTGLGRQWRVSHYLGARAIHAFDHVDLEEEALTEEDPKLSERRYTWLNLYAHNGYYHPDAQPGVTYSADATVLIGRREDFRAATELEPASREEFDVTAVAGDLGLRWRLPTAAPFQVGAAYAFGSGDRDDNDRSERFEQTGLHSNRSRFTGTRSPLYRYGDALQPDLSNLHIASLYLSIPQERWDASLIYHRYARHRGREAIAADGIDVQPETDDRDIGNGVDLAVAYYFGNPIGRGASRIGVPQENDDTRSNLRLRASTFNPGDAFAAAADSQHRVTLELTLWF
jgi:alginate production protein